jgi:KDO2-lipid IV(A) lauroyltransferase
MFFFLEYLLIRFLGGLVNLLPFSLVLALARPAGNLLFGILPKNRRMALANLERAFGAEKSPTEIRKIAIESFVYLIEFGITWLRMPQLAKNPGRYLSARQAERVHEAIKNKKGAMILVSHAGNWAVMALIGGIFLAKPAGTLIHALARPLKNSFLYDYTLRLRGLAGLRSIPKSGAVQGTFRALKRNEIVCLLIDQRVEEGSIETDFFGRKALTTSLPALAALRLGTPIFFGSFQQKKGPVFNLTFEGPLPVERTGNSRQDIQLNTQRFNDYLEAEIRRSPGRWLWMHNRWRGLVGGK